MMAERERTPLAGQIVDETMEITIVQLCETCAVKRKLIEEMIDEGILETSGRRGSGRRLPYSSVRRTQVVLRLQKDLGVNLSGAALALQLLDQIENLRAQLRARGTRSP